MPEIAELPAGREGETPPSYYASGMSANICKLRRGTGTCGTESRVHLHSLWWVCHETVAEVARNPRLRAPIHEIAQDCAPVLPGQARTITVPARAWPTRPTVDQRLLQARDTRSEEPLDPRKKRCLAQRVTITADGTYGLPHYNCGRAQTRRCPCTRACQSVERRAVDCRSSDSVRIVATADLDRLSN